LGVFFICAVACENLSLKKQITRVNWPVIKQLSAYGRPDQGEGSIVSGVQTKLEPLLLVHVAH
jgi:hypothetical protein